MIRTRLLAAFAALPMSLLAVSPDLVISHVYGAGGNTGATWRNDFVVVFNRASSSVSLAGKSIQYTSATGTGLFSQQPVVALTGTLAAGQYHLVQLAGGANGTLLPAADTTGTTSMAAGAGKVALVNSTTGLTCNGGSTACSAGQLALIIDLVGYGNANFFEGAAGVATLNATTWAVRANGGCTDTDSNSTDFATATSGTIPNSATTAAPCAPSQPVLSINDVNISEGNSGTTNLNFTVSLSAAAGAGGVTFDIATADNTATLANSDYQQVSLPGQSIAQGNQTFVFSVPVIGDLTVEPNETFFVNVTNVVGSVLGDGQGQGTIQNDDVTTVSCTRTHFISQVQGSGNTSPVNGQTVTVDAIVTANKFNGFFVQERDTNADANPLTSEGIFVFTNNASGPAVGTNVCVTGTITEFGSGALQLTEFASGAAVGTVSLGNPLPAAIALSAAFPASGGSIDQLERLEGMRVTASSFTAASGTLEASGFDNASFYAVVTGVTRPFREPGIEAPLGVPSGSSKTIPPIPRFDANSEVLRIDLRGQNQAAGVAVTAGQTVTNVAGVLDYTAGGGYELLQDANATAVVSGGSTFTAVPAPATNQITIGQMSLENYTGTATQQAKALRVMRDVLRYPDVVGVSEVSGLTALQNLAAAINGAQAGLNYTAYLGETTSAQDIGFLVKTARITVLGTPGPVLAGETFIDPSNGNVDVLHDRAPFVVKGRALTGNGGNFDFTAMVVHLRSLIGVDSEAVNGATTEGNRVRTKRRAAAENLASYLQTQQLANPNERFIVVGDYNAFEFNDGYVDVLGTLTGNPTPNAQVVQASGDLVTPNFIDLVTTNKISAAERYSYIFGVSRQVLDHVVVSQSFGAFISGLHFGRANADFPEAFRADASRPERVTDHDPVLAFVTLPNNPVNDITGVTRVASTGLVLVSGGYNGFVRLTNLSGQALTGPLHVLFDTLPAGVTVANAAGTFQGKPYVSTPGPLANGATVNIAVRYLNPGNVLIQPTYRALQGSF